MPSQQENATNDVEKPIRNRSRWLLAFRFVVAATVIAALIYVISNSAKQFSASNFDIASLDLKYILLAITCYWSAMILSFWYWKTILRTFDCHASWRKTLLAFFVSQLGKYVPGKAMVVVIRTDLAGDKNSNTRAIVASVFVETLTWIFVGSVIACLLLASKFNEHTALKWTAIGLAISAGTLTFPSVFRLIATKVTRNESSVFEKLKLTNLTFGWLLMTIGWCLNAMSLYCVIQAMSLAHTAAELCWEDFPLMLACVSLATVAGFASLLPGGIGVRELVIIPLLGPRFGVPMAIIAAILIRLVWIATELLSSGIIYLAFRNGTSSKHESD